MTLASLDEFRGQEVAMRRDAFPPAEGLAKAGGNARQRVVGALSDFPQRRRVVTVLNIGSMEFKEPNGKILTVDGADCRPIAGKLLAQIPACRRRRMQPEMDKA